MRVIGPNCLGVVNTAPDVRMNATFAPVAPVARPRRVPLAVGRARHRADEPRRRARHRHLRVRLGRQQGRRQRQRPAAVLGGRSEHRRDPPLPRVVREPAQVRPARAPASRGASRSSRSRAAARRPAAAPRRRTRPRSPRPTSPSTRCSARPASSASTRSRSCSTPRRCSRTSRSPPGRRVAIVGNAGGPGILAADACAGAGLEVPELSDGDPGPRCARSSRHDASVAQSRRPRRGPRPRSSSSARCGVVLADAASTRCSRSSCRRS